MDSLKLISAICYIQLNILTGGDYIIRIEFEDGSLEKFNYWTSYDSTPQFIDLTEKLNNKKLTYDQFVDLIKAKKKPYGEALDEVSIELKAQGIEHQEYYDKFNDWLAS